MNYGFGVDEMASLGYEYARSGGQNDIPDFKEEMDLLAFNSGIANANSRFGLRIPKIGFISSTRHDKQPAETDKVIGLGYS